MRKNKLIITALCCIFYLTVTATNVNAYLKDKSSLPLINLSIKQLINKDFDRGYRSYNILQLSLVKKSDEPNSSDQRFHLLKIKNNSNESLTVTFQAEQINCEGVSLRQASLNYSFVDQEGRMISNNQVTLDGNSTKQFYIKTTRQENSPLESYNCVEITAQRTNTSERSNVVSIRTFIPNPQNFN